MTFEEVFSYITKRCSVYGLSLEQGLEMVHPDVLSQATPDELYNHWKQLEISHEHSQKLFPELRTDPLNMFLEHEIENGERQEATATDEERNQAWEDQLTDFNDQDYNDNGIPDLIEAELELVHI